MPKFCGKCGSKLDEVTGQCTNCGNGAAASFPSAQTSSNLSNKTIYAGMAFEDDDDDGNLAAGTLYAKQPENEREGYNGRGVEILRPMNFSDEVEISYEGAASVPNNPVPPQPQTQNTASQPSEPKVNYERRVGKMKPTFGKRFRVVSIVLVIAILFTGFGVLSYKEVINIPGVSNVIKVKLDERMYGNTKNDFVITGESISDEKIIDELSAKDAAKNFSKKIGCESIADEYTLINISKVSDYTYYRFQENYKDYPVYGRQMVIVADSDGNSCGGATNVVSINKSLKTKMSDFNRDSVYEELDDLESAGMDVKINSYTKTIYSLDYDEDPKLVYQVMAVVNNVNYTLFVEPEEGEVIDGYCMDYSQSYNLSGDGKNMMNNPQHFNGAKFGSQYVMYDEERNISVYNSEKGSSAITVAYYDGHDKLYFNRRFDIGGVSEIIGDDVCVIHDEDGKYYEYDAETGLFVHDDEKVDPNDLMLEGYTVFNRYSGKELTPVGSDSMKIDDPDAVSLMVKTSQVYDMYEQLFGRIGYDGREGKIMAVCNDDVSGYPNKAMSAGDNSGFTMITFGYNNKAQLDDVAHEYAHSVEQSICSLMYKNESGAVMEACSDIFGELAEDIYNDNGRLSEDNLNNNCDWYAGNRSVRNPIMTQNPDKYMGKNYVKKLVAEDWKDTKFGVSNDYGGTHKNSTVLSYCAYLMVSEGSDDEKLSCKQLADLWYRTLFLLSPDTTFSAFRTCMEVEADRMKENGELTEEQREYVSKCFGRVNIASEVYSSELKIDVLADVDDNIFTVDIKGKRFKLVGMRRYSEKLTLDDEPDEYNDCFVYSDTIKLEDGSYTVTVRDETSGRKVIERDIVVKTNEKSRGHYSLANDKLTFYSLPEPEMPEGMLSDTDLPTDNGHLPEGQLPEGGLPQ